MGKIMCSSSLFFSSIDFLNFKSQILVFRSNTLGCMGWRDMRRKGGKSLHLHRRLLQGGEQWVSYGGLLLLMVMIFIKDPILDLVMCVQVEARISFGGGKED